MKQKLLIKWLVVISVIQLVVICTISLLFLSQQKSLLKQSLINKLKLTSKFYTPFVKRSLKSRDDLAIMSYLESITNNPEFLYARVLDNKGKIVAHNRINEWGRIANDSITQKIIISKEPILHAIQEPEGYVYSVPISKEKPKRLYFSVGISLEKTNIKFNETKNKTLKYVIIVFIFGAIISLWFFYKIVISPLNQLYSITESVILGKPGEKVVFNRKDEIGSLAGLINKIIDKTLQQGVVSQPETDSQQKETLKTIIKNLCQYIKDGIIVTDSDNNIIYINENGKKVLNVQDGDIEGKHIIDVIKTTEILDLLKESNNNLNKTIEKHLPIINASIKIVTIGNPANQPMATLICC